MHTPHFSLRLLFFPREFLLIFKVFEPELLQRHVIEVVDNKIMFGFVG
jgi:hypothetical protein